MLVGLRYNIAAAEAKHEEQLSHWSLRIDEQVATLRVRANEHRLVVQNPLVYDGGTSCEEALQHVASVSGEVEAMAAEAAELRSFQSTLKLGVTRCEEVDDMLLELRLVEGMWRGFGEVATLEGR